MSAQRSLFIILFSLFLASALPIVQAESIANASVVLSMCQAIATKTEKILQQQQQDYLLAYWSRANNIGTYVSKWSDLVKSQGADPTEVYLCTAKFNQTLYRNREGMNDEMTKKNNARMLQIDAEMFEILAKDMKPETLEKYVNIVKGIAETALRTAKNEGDTLLKTSVNSLKASYQLAANCLRKLMISVDPTIIDVPVK